MCGASYRHCIRVDRQPGRKRRKEGPHRSRQKGGRLLLCHNPLRNMEQLFHINSNLIRVCARPTVLIVFPHVHELGVINDRSGSGPWPCEMAPNQSYGAHEEEKNECFCRTRSTMRLTNTDTMHVRIFHKKIRFCVRAIHIGPSLLRIHAEQQTCPSRQKLISTSYVSCFTEDGQVGEIGPDKLTVVSGRGNPAYFRPKSCRLAGSRASDRKRGRARCLPPPRRKGQPESRLMNPAGQELARKRDWAITRPAIRLESRNIKAIKLLFDLRFVS